MPQSPNVWRRFSTTSYNYLYEAVLWDPRRRDVVMTISMSLPDLRLNPYTDVYGRP